MFRRRAFTETGPDLTPAQRSRSIRLAKRAAGESKESLTLTARRQYLRYRDEVGDDFLSWAEWAEHYRAFYGTQRAVFVPNPRVYNESGKLM